MSFERKTFRLFAGMLAVASVIAVVILWSWITTDKNARGLQVVTALLGLIGLFWYTLETNVMRQLAEQRASTEDRPYLRMESHRLNSISIEVGVRNYGRGPALDLECWDVPGIEVGPFFRPSEGGRYTPVGSLMPGNNTIHTERLRDPSSPDQTLIFQCGEVNGRLHQLQLNFFESGFRVISRAEPIDEYLERVHKLERDSRQRKLPHNQI